VGKTPEVMRADPDTSACPLAGTDFFREIGSAERPQGGPDFVRLATGEVAPRADIPGFSEADIRAADSSETRRT
jgi:hypothetical protein